MLARLSMVLALTTFAAGCVTTQGAAPANEAICEVLAGLNLTEDDADRVSEQLARSLDTLLEARRKAGC
jgi:hypothetical protein